MIFVIGEILFDCFPDYRRLGGAPFNVAFHMHHMGLPVRMISRVGDDAPGKEILVHMQKKGLDVSGVQVDGTHPTGSVKVQLDKKGVPEFTIQPDVAYDFLSPDAILEQLDATSVDMIYFGSLVQRTQHGFDTLKRVLSHRDPHTRYLYDINLRPGCCSDEVILNALEAADILKLNTDELDAVRRLMHTTSTRKQDIATALCETFRIGTIALTKGEAGAELFSQAGHFQCSSPPLRNVSDTVGAGDAFAAILAMGDIKQWEPDIILSRATRFAADVCTLQGAVPGDLTLYKRLDYI